MPANIEPHVSKVTPLSEMNGEPPLKKKPGRPPRIRDRKAEKERAAVRAAEGLPTQGRLPAPRGLDPVEQLSLLNGAVQQIGSLGRVKELLTVLEMLTP